MTSAPGCWALYGELCALFLSDPDSSSYRQCCADAFAVQHPGTPEPRAIQSVAVHLVSLHARFVAGASADQAAMLLERGVRAKVRFHWLEPPSFATALTVGNVLQRAHELPVAARQWTESAWTAWTPHHRQIQVWHDLLSSALTRSHAFTTPHRSH
jgi:hypothetical protein